MDFCPQRYIGEIYIEHGSQKFTIAKTRSDAKMLLRHCIYHDCVSGSCLHLCPCRLSSEMPCIIETYCFAGFFGFKCSTCAQGFRSARGMADKCAVCAGGFEQDAEKHPCSLSQAAACHHVCHQDCLQTYRLKHSCPENECPFCARKDALEEELDDKALQEMECEADAVQDENFAVPRLKRDAAEPPASPARPHKKVPDRVSPSQTCSPVPATQCSASPETPPLTQGGGQAACLSIPTFGINIFDVSRTKEGAAAAQDPMERWLSQYSACTDDQEGLLLLHTKTTFQGIGSPDACYQTVRAWLLAAAQDPRDHHGVAGGFAFSTRDMLPVPFETSLRTIARKEGWEPETFMAPFLSNIGWMENPGTRLRLQPDEEHRRGCVVQVVCAGDPSMRKSSLKEYASKTLLSHADVPAPIREGRCTSTDATIKGIRSSIQEHQGRAGIISDEIATTYAVTSGRDVRASGVHFGNKDKMCTWLNCEDDSTVTGEGSMVLSEYSFVHQVYGQVPLCEYVLQPSASMFSKRIHATWQVRPAACDPDQQSQFSKEFLVDFFGWMGRTCCAEKRDHHFDKFALPVLRKALQAISDFLQEHHRDVEDPIQQKMRYADTDLARYANAAMRCRQFAESMRSDAGAGTSEDQDVQMSIFDLGHALHIWHRQMCLWVAFFRSKQVESLGGSKPLPNASSRDVVPLDAEMKLQRVILSNPRCAGVVSTAMIRPLLKYHFQKEKEKDPAKKIVTAVRKLMTMGILKEIEKTQLDQKVQEEKGGKRKADPLGGHVVLYYRKATWEELLSNPEAQEYIAQLELGANHFA